MSSFFQVDGQWRLLYSTISILGSKRTKLGLRDFITLGEFIQTVDVKKVTLMFNYNANYLVVYARE